MFSAFERRVLLTVISTQWREHLKRLDDAYADIRARPGRTSHLIVAFRRPSEESDSLMQQTIARDVLGYLFHAEP